MKMMGVILTFKWLPDRYSHGESGRTSKVTAVSATRQRTSHSVAETLHGRNEVGGLRLADIRATLLRLEINGRAPKLVCEQFGRIAAMEPASQAVSTKPKAP